MFALPDHDAGPAAARTGPRQAPRPRASSRWARPVGGHVHSSGQPVGMLHYVHGCGGRWDMSTPACPFRGTCPHLGCGLNFTPRPGSGPYPCASGHARSPRPIPGGHVQPWARRGGILGTCPLVRRWRGHVPGGGVRRSGGTLALDSGFAVGKHGAKGTAHKVERSRLNFNISIFPGRSSLWTRNSPPRARRLLRQPP